jgi:hypothetical protein
LPWVTDALAEIRTSFGGNDKAFGKYVKANGLDKEYPFDGEHGNDERMPFVQNVPICFQLK